MSDNISREEIIEADVLCIGGGIAGLMAAIRASELGAKVVVVEKGNAIGSGRDGQATTTSGAIFRKCMALIWKPL